MPHTHAQILYTGCVMFIQLVCELADTAAVAAADDDDSDGNEWFLFRLRWLMVSD